MLIGESIFTAIDFESAGTAAGYTDAPVQVATATWSVDQGLLDQWMSYIYTEQKITWKAQEIHGITKENLLDAPKLSTLWRDLNARLVSRVVVAHGYGTEKRFLRAFPGHGFSPWVDTLQLARKAYPYLSDYALGALCEMFQLKEKIDGKVKGKGWHDALYDAVATIFLLEHIIEEFSLAGKSTDFIITQ